MFNFSDGGAYITYLMLLYLPWVKLFRILAFLDHLAIVYLKSKYVVKQQMMLPKGPSINDVTPAREGGGSLKR